MPDHSVLLCLWWFRTWRFATFLSVLPPFHVRPSRFECDRTAWVASKCDGIGWIASPLTEMTGKLSLKAICKQIKSAPAWSWALIWTKYEPPGVDAGMSWLYVNERVPLAHGKGLKSLMLPLISIGNLMPSSLTVTWYLPDETGSSRLPVTLSDNVAPLAGGQTSAVTVWRAKCELDEHALNGTFTANPWSARNETENNATANKRYILAENNSSYERHSIDATTIDNI